MEKKLLVSDFDGTLCQANGIPPHVVEAIDRFRAAGNLFGVATGRDRHWGYEIFKEQGMFPFDFILSLNGALALDGEGNVLYTLPIDGTAPCGDSTLARVIPYRIYELGGDDCSPVWENERIFIEPEHLHPADPADKNATPWGSKEDMFRKMDAFLMLNTGCNTVEEATVLTEKLQAEFGTWLNPMQNGRLIDLPARGVDKGVSIARYAELMGVAHDDIWTAGDNFNDIAMLERYHGCAMASGTAEAQAAAEYVCGDIADVIGLIMGE